MNDNHYTKKYFLRHKKNNLINKLFIHLIDRREPVLSYLVKNKSSESKLLDVGCGNGNFLKHSQKYFKCEGFDLSTDAIQLLKTEVPNIKLSVNNLFAYSNKSLFEIVTCFDVLEHLVDPTNALIKLKSLINDEGLIAISMPNGSSMGRKLKGKKWFGYEDQTHIWFNDANHWRQIICESGLIVEFEGGDGLGYPPYLPFIPKFLQDIFIKYPSQLAGIYNLPLPLNFHETIYFVCRKNMGWESTHYKRQLELNHS